jgi:hypothetical protein
VADYHTCHVGQVGILVHNTNDYANSDTRSTSDLGVDAIRKVTNVGNLGSGGRSGGKRPLTGQPNTYGITNAGHELVYDSDGLLNLDISSERVRATIGDKAPDGASSPRDVKLLEPVPPQLLEGW